MRKSIIILALTSLIVFLLIKYGFIIVFWLTAPEYEKSTECEAALFNKVQLQLNAKKVYRENNPQNNRIDTALYLLVIEEIKCCNISKDSLNSIALSIKNSIDSCLKQRKEKRSKQIRYVIMFVCADTIEKYQEFIFHSDEK